MISPAQHEIVKNPLEALVGQIEEQRHDHDKGEHRAGRLHGFLACRPDNLFRLDHGFVGKGEEALSRFGFPATTAASANPARTARTRKIIACSESR